MAQHDVSVVPHEPESGESPDSPVDLNSSDLYINRELSLLEFQRRVLNQALNRSLPLLERVKFLAILSSNLDEFFMVRVAGLIEQRMTNIDSLGPDNLSATTQLATIRRTVTELTTLQRECWNLDVKPALRREGIIQESYADLSEEEKQYLKRHFEQQIYPVLTPQAVDVARPFPHISSLSLNMLIVVEDMLGEHVARLKIPPVIPRFVRVPDLSGRSIDELDPHNIRFVLLEEVVEANLQILFPGKIVKHAYMFRLTRDADYEIRENSADSLLKAVEAELERRLFGFVVRLTVEPAMPAEWRSWLSERFNLSPSDVYVMDRPLGLADIMELTNIDRPDLKDPPFTPRVPQWFRDPNTSVFDILQRREVLLFHPYDSFTPVIDLVRQASNDPNVVAIKQTLYRIGSQSPIVDALLEARDDEKQVAVLVELKARFDEESNINWARQLESNGVHVAYGISAGLKTHCKVTLIVRREGDQLRRYVHLGTGNYNPTTARLYTDLSFMTTDEDIAADVSDVFNQLTGYSAQTEYRKLLVAPVNVRSKITELIRKEAGYGADGRIMMKMNSISDRSIIRELYRASQAGVQIELLARGICSLRPGVPGVSETIRVRSIVGRFLEHARAYYFAHGSESGDEAMYVGSADLMPRNLDYRVETLFPIEDPVFLRYIRDDIMRYQLRDNVNNYELQSDGTYLKVTPRDGEPLVDSQSLPGPAVPDASARAVPVMLR